MKTFSSIFIFEQACLLTIYKWMLYTCSVTSLMSNCLWHYELKPSRLLCPWDSPGKNTGVGCHALLQGIFLTQGLNPCLQRLLHLQVASLPTELPGKSINGHLILNLKHDERVCVILGCACKNCLEEYHICQAGEIWLSTEMFGKGNLALSYIVCYVI